MKTDLHTIFDQQYLIDRLKEQGVPSFRKKQIYTEIFTHSIISFQEMTTLPVDLRTKLSESFQIIPFELDSIYENPDSTKIGFKLSNGSIVESVVMFHHHEKDRNDSTSAKDIVLNRVTLCISSQVGCPVGCIFCVTGKLGFGKNLGYDEMIAQVIRVNHYLKDKLGKKGDGTWWKVRNIVFMGMGEPLLNYDNVKMSLEFMLKQEFLSLSKRHVTISTSGIIPGIDRLVQDGIDCALALSLHAPNQSLREKLIPTIAKGYTLDKLMEVIDRYTQATGNRIFYEYIMIDQMTDLPELAHELVMLLRDRSAHVNLIPYNPNPAMPELRESSIKAILAFRDILEAGGITVTARINRGRTIKGACGQLGYEKVVKGEKVVFEKKR
ncbi:MAG TPA: 23S rRNA (adenine(2503)-C(2))-methyltransferase RlmN [Candidatus Absconditabacterales bacterium]|nr:23S rRNA (adenine(2503)-C(2))-methyltransferase RlmN [Candidatus Absconditabacterales bacterium]